MNWSFRQFAEKEIVKAGKEVSRAEVWMGSASTVGLTPAEDLTTLVPVLGSDNMTAEVVYEGPLSAPISQGDELAQLVFTPEGLPEMRVPLVASESVAVGGFAVRLKTVAGVLLKRLQQGPEGAL